MLTKKRKYTDAEVITYIKSKEKILEVKALKYLYGSYHALVKNLINKFKINESNLDDILMEAIMDLYRNIVKDKFKGDSKLSTYFYKIAENKIKDLLRKSSKKNVFNIENGNGATKNIYDIYEKRELSKELYSLLKKLRTVCADIPTLSFFYELSNDEILDKIPTITNPDSLKTQKYKCIQELKKIMKSNEELYQAIREIEL